MVRNTDTVAVVAVLLCLLVGGLAQRRLEENHDLPPEATSRPVIGVLSIELTDKAKEVVGAHHSYIAASYVKFIEGAGARVAPILIGQPAEYYRRMVQGVNGLLLPGGATYFNEPNGFYAAGEELYRLAREVNEAGVHFPVLGICLGMELLMVAAAGVDFRSKCVSEDPLPLDFLPGAKHNSRLFGRAPRAVVRTLEKQNVTVNHHMYCITRDGMKRQGLDKEWRTLAVNKDPNGVEFVSVFEHERLPIYGLQFHPEKNAYEWKADKNYPHSEAAIAAARHFADFLVAEARRNTHSFPPEAERDQLIYRHQPVDTMGRLMWEQLYVFSAPKTEGQPQPPTVAAVHPQVPEVHLEGGMPNFDV